MLDEALLARQYAEGALPMGYGECRRIAWVADNGTAVLAPVQLASFLPPKKAAYLKAVRRYYDWRETFRITPERARQLDRQFGPSEHNRIGTYGIGYNDGPFFEKQKTAETIRVERGYPWTLGISMVSLPGYYRLTGDEAAARLAQQNLTDYLEMEKQPNYFGAEALFWMYAYLPDRAAAGDAARRLLDGSLPRMLAERGPAGLGISARRTLDMLSLLYLQRHLENSPRLRAAMLRHLWCHADPEAPFSVRRIGDSVRHSSHGFSIGAAHATSFVAIWLTELLYPGATLLNPEITPLPPPAP